MAKKKKIMVVDDEEDITKLVQLMLEIEGFEVVAAHSGQEALDKVCDEMPDLILLDIMMPEMDGWEVYRRLKQDKRTTDIPVAMLTAKTTPLDINIGLHVAKADDYITKPFERKDLLERIKRMLD